MIRFTPPQYIRLLLAVIFLTNVAVAVVVNVFAPREGLHGVTDTLRAMALKRPGQAVQPTDQPIDVDRQQVAIGLLADMADARDQNNARWRTIKAIVASLSTIGAFGSLHALIWFETYFRREEASVES